ncbi:MAG: DUF4139 domain-containing protein [Candidatus Zixiibacteriota bacterium]|nr:MAG: DUF4139 domain-containing protein [candidate division Zixibacteria bacterium]
MKSTLFITGILLMAQTAAAQVSVTVYNQNLGLVKETRPIEVQKGLFQVEIADVAAQIDPTSVHLTLDGAAIFEQNFEYDLVSRERLLEKYLNQPIQVYTEQGEMFEGTLQSASGTELILRRGDGQIMVIVPDAVRDIRFGELPGGLRTEPTLVWTLQGDRAGRRNAELSYLTHGMNWHAEYVAVTGEKTDRLELASWVSLENHSGATYENAKLKLIAGDVRLVQPPGPFDGGRERMVPMMAESQAAPKFEEKAFFEYHMYTLDQPTTLRDRQTKQISLFPPATVEAHREYVFDSQKNPEKVMVNLVFQNEKARGLGLPLPAGKVRVYQRDDDNTLEFVGEDRIDHTPRDEEVRLVVGSAFDLSAEKQMTNMQRISDRVREETYRVEIRNHKAERVEVTVVEHLWGAWEILESSHPYEKTSAFEVKFKVPVQPDQETVLTYRVRRQ